MAGVKGQKWGDKSRPKKATINVSLEPGPYKDVLKLAEEKKWSASLTAAELIKIGLKHLDEL